MAALGEASETPERLWTPAMRATTAEELAHLAAQAHAAQVTLAPLHLGLLSFWVVLTLHLLLVSCDIRVHTLFRSLSFLCTVVS